MPYDVQRPTGKECSLCGATMRLHEYEKVDIIPGMSEVKKRKMSEWVCPDCDNFEEVDREGEG